MKICIDPGHGGNDSGADGPTGLPEAKVILDISKRISEQLKGLGFTTKLTRESDVFIELAQRCSIANSWGANYFVSVHLNSNGPSAVGIETLYTSISGKEFASPVHKALIAATGDVDRGLKERDDLHVLNGTNMPAILLELGFISHPETESKLKTEDYKNLLTKATVEGIVNHLGIPGSSKK
jgi:N-acetylmuramoyl-L-alanine amidase